MHTNAVHTHPFASRSFGDKSRDGHQPVDNHEVVKKLHTGLCVKVEKRCQIFLLCPSSAPWWQLQEASRQAHAMQQHPQNRQQQRRPELLWRVSVSPERQAAVATNDRGADSRPTEPPRVVPAGKHWPSATGVPGPQAPGSLAGRGAAEPDQFFRPLWHLRVRWENQLPGTGPPPSKRCSASPWLG